MHYLLVEHIFLTHFTVFNSLYVCVTLLQPSQLHLSIWHGFIF